MDLIICGECGNKLKVAGYCHICYNKEYSKVNQLQQENERLKKQVNYDMKYGYYEHPSESNPNGVLWSERCLELEKENERLKETKKMVFKHLEAILDQFGAESDGECIGVDKFRRSIINRNISYDEILEKVKEILKESIKISLGLSNDIINKWTSDSLGITENEKKELAEFYTSLIEQYCFDANHLVNILPKEPKESNYFDLLIIKI